MNLPLGDLIFTHPDWVSLPTRIWVGGMFLILFLVSLRYGPSRAVSIVLRFRWLFVATLIAVVAWGVYGSIVLNPSPSWLR